MNSQGTSGHKDNKPSYPGKHTSFLTVSLGVGTTKHSHIDLLNESEGEAGDNKIYAERANGIVTQWMKHKPVEIQPVPKFEKSVFDMKYTDKKEMPNAFQRRK